MKDKKVLVTVASGFIGRNLVSLLTDKYEVYPLARKGAGLKNEIITDLTNADFPRCLPKVGKVVHLGAKVAWGADIKKELFAVNVMATEKLAKWAMDVCAQFIFASTAIIFGSRNSRITSASPLNLDTDYAYSKWLAEEAVRACGGRHTILRIAGVFWQDGPAHLKINQSISGALAGIPPVCYGAGSARRNYIYVKDLCRVIEHCCENSVEGSHLVAGSFTDTIARMLNIICATLLPGESPKFVGGKDGVDQVIEYSRVLPEARSFEDAVREIKEEAQLWGRQ